MLDVEKRKTDNPQVQQTSMHQYLKILSCSLLASSPQRNTHRGRITAKPTAGKQHCTKHGGSGTKAVGLKLEEKVACQLDFLASLRAESNSSIRGLTTLNAAAPA
jgi:hypothetical protein